ncbi:MAG: DNA repair protein RecO [bacterium]|nr:DNA repair protein RecO [bacterium]
MPLHHVEAVVLRRRRSRDADAILTLFTRENGKIAASTRGVLKTSSRMAGVTQPFNRLHAVLYAKTRDQDIWTLTQGSLIESYRTIQTDLNRLAFASCLAEWIDFLSEDFSSDQAVWHLLTGALSRWNEREPRAEDLIYYQWRLLRMGGLEPEIFRCPRTGATESPAWRYLAAEGGVIRADACEGGETLHAGSVMSLRQIARAADPPNVRLSTQQRREIQRLIQLHLEYHAGRQSRASLFFDKISHHQASLETGAASPPEELPGP